MKARAVLVSGLLALFISTGCDLIAVTSPEEDQAIDGALVLDGNLPISGYYPSVAALRNAAQAGDFTVCLSISGTVVYPGTAPCFTGHWYVQGASGSPIPFPSPTATPQPGTSPAPTPTPSHTPAPTPSATPTPTPTPYTPCSIVIAGDSALAGTYNSVAALVARAQSIGYQGCINISGHVIFSGFGPCYQNSSSGSCF